MNNVKKMKNTNRSVLLSCLPNGDFRYRARVLDPNDCFH